MVVKRLAGPASNAIQVEVDSHPVTSDAGIGSTYRKSQVSSTPITS